jgi:hypothetical protein
MMEKLAKNETLKFKIGDNDLEIVMSKEEDDFDHFDRVFSRIWHSILDRAEKVVYPPHK